LLSAGADGPGSPRERQHQVLPGLLGVRASPDSLKQVNSLLIKKKTLNLSMAVLVHLFEIRDNVTWALAP